MPSRKGSRGKPRTSKSTTTASQTLYAGKTVRGATKPSKRIAAKRPAVGHKVNGRHASAKGPQTEAANSVVKANGKAAAMPVTITPLTPHRTKARLQEEASGTDVHHKQRSPNGARIRAAAHRSQAKRSEIVLPPDYRPLESEPFMNERHRIYFRNKLLAWKEEILRLNMETLKGLHDESAQQADPADRATAETDRALELRARDRQRKLMNKIDAALARIEDGSYGYCEETGEPISLKRLDARPIATLSIEAQEKRERRERIFRDD